MDKYKLLLDGKIVKVSSDGTETELERDSFKLISLENGEKFVTVDGKNYPVEKEQLVNVKSPEDFPRAIGRLYEAVTRVNRTQEELHTMNAHLQELVKAYKAEGATQRMGERRGEYAVDGDFLFGTMKSPNDILNHPVQGVKMTMDGKGGIEETAPSEPKSLKAWEFQKWNDELYLLSKLTGLPIKSLNRYKSFQNWFDQTGLRKAIDTATSGEGSDWIPTGYSARLFEKVHLNYLVAALHDVIPMPNSPFIPPVQTSDATAYFIPENKDDEGTKITASTPGSSNFTLTARKIAARVVASAEASEDTVFPLIPFVERNIANAIAYGVEDCIVNGDTTATHQDSNVTAATDVRKAWKGYRKLASDKSATVDFSNVTPTADKHANIRYTMGSPYAISPARLAWVVSGITYLLLMKDTDLQTVDKYGQFATLLTGELGRMYNIPVIVSEKQQEDLNASGVYDGSTTNRSVSQLVYRPGFVLGMRTSGVQVDRMKDIERDQWKIVAIHRVDFQSVYGTSDKTVANGYNIKES